MARISVSEIEFAIEVMPVALYDTCETTAIDSLQTGCHHICHDLRDMDFPKMKQEIF